MRKEQVNINLNVNNNKKIGIMNNSDLPSARVKLSIKKNESDAIESNLTIGINDSGVTNKPLPPAPPNGACIDILKGIDPAPYTAIKSTSGCAIGGYGAINLSMNANDESLPGTTAIHVQEKMGQEIKITVKDVENVENLDEIKLIIGAEK